MLPSTFPIGYPWETVYESNMAEDSACASGGDSGGSYTDSSGTYALGITIGAAGCPNADSFYNLVNNAAGAMNTYLWLGG